MCSRDSDPAASVKQGCHGFGSRTNGSSLDLSGRELRIVHRYRR